MVNENYSPMAVHRMIIGILYGYMCRGLNRSRTDPMQLVIG